MLVLGRNQMVIGYLKDLAAPKPRQEVAERRGAPCAVEAPARGIIPDAINVMSSCSRATARRPDPSRSPPGNSCSASLCALFCGTAPNMGRSSEYI